MGSSLRGRIFRTAEREIRTILHRCRGKILLEKREWIALIGSSQGKIKESRVPLPAGKLPYRCFTGRASGGLSTTDLYICSISAEYAPDATGVFGLLNAKI